MDADTVLNLDFCFESFLTVIFNCFHQTLIELKMKVKVKGSLICGSSLFVFLMSHLQLEIM